MLLGWVTSLKMDLLMGLIHRGPETGGSLEFSSERVKNSNGSNQSTENLKEISRVQNSYSASIQSSQQSVAANTTENTIESLSGYSPMGTKGVIEALDNDSEADKWKDISVTDEDEDHANDNFAGSEEEEETYGGDGALEDIEEVSEMNNEAADLGVRLSFVDGDNEGVQSLGPESSFRQKHEAKTKKEGKKAN